MLKCTIIIAFLINPFAKIFTQDTEQSSSFYFYSESEITSKYIFRGIVLEDNPVFQPAVYASYIPKGKFGSVTCGVWFNFSMPHEKILLDEESYVQEKKHFQFSYNETDIYIIHETALKKLTIKNTFALYLFKNETGYPNTTEYILNLGYPAGEFSLLSEFACDISANPGAYVFTHGISWDNEITKNIAFSSAVNIIWGSAKYNNVNAGINKILLNSTGFESSLTYNHSSGFYTKIRYQYNKIHTKELTDIYGYDSWCIGLLAGMIF